MNRFGATLGQYGATLGTSDVALLRKINDLDGQSSILKLNPFIWGETAPIFYAAVGDNRYSLFKIPKSNHVLGQYKSGMMTKTIQNFPLDLSLDPMVDYDDRPDIYDPRYILISLYHLLGPENAVNVNQVIKSAGLSLALVGTSSSVSSMRHLSYLVLERLCFHLEASKSTSVIYFWVNLLDSFRATMSSPNQQMSFLLTSLLVRIVEIINSPKDALFYLLKDFITVKPRFENHQVSLLFTNLLTSKDINWKQCQRFVLNLLANSVKTEDDLKICRSNNLFDHILSLYQSKWTDPYDKLLILQFIKNSVQITQSLDKLIIENGLIVWLTNLISSTTTFDLAQRETIVQLMDILQSTIKSTNLPKSSYKHLGFIKPAIKSMNQEATTD